MNVVGLDLSLRASGVARADGTTTVVSSARRGIARIIDLRRQITAEVRPVQEAAADLVVLEDYAFSSPRGSHAHEIGELGGAVKVWLTEAEVAWVAVLPNLVKRFATGKGNCDKTAMALAAYKTFGLEFPNDNACDAMWLRAMGLYRFSDAGAARTTYRDEAVSKVDWPALANTAPPNQTALV